MKKFLSTLPTLHPLISKHPAIYLVSAKPSLRPSLPKNIDKLFSYVRNVSCSDEINNLN